MNEQEAKAALTKAMRAEGWLVYPYEDRFSKSRPDLVVSRDFHTAFLETKVLDWLWEGPGLEGLFEQHINFKPLHGSATKGKFRIHQTMELVKLAMKAWKVEFTILFPQKIGPLLVGVVHPSSVLHSYKQDLAVPVKTMEVPEWLRRLAQ